MSLLLNLHLILCVIVALYYNLLLLLIHLIEMNPLENGANVGERPQFFLESVSMVTVIIIVSLIIKSNKIELFGTAALSRRSSLLRLNKC